MIRRTLSTSLIAASLLASVAGVAFSSSSCGRAQTPSAQAKMQGAVNQIRFPESWTETREGVEWPQPSYFERLEVRKSPGAPEDEYLIAGVIYSNDYLHELHTDLPPPQYTRQFYVVRFNDNFRVRPATERDWQQARRVSSPPHMLVNDGRHADTRTGIEYRGFKYAKTGEHWRRATLSPGGKWIAVFSYSGRKTKPNLFFGDGEPRTGDAFWDIYDTFTGERVAAWSARGVARPTSYDTAETWLGERYFLAPADEQKQTYLAFTLPAFAPVKNPGTINFPEWLAADGKQLRLPRPQDDKDIEWSQRGYEVRRLVNSSVASAPELLFRLKDEFILLLPPSRGPDGGGMRGKQLRANYSASIYAVALDGTYRVRAATPAEWEAAKKIEATQTKRTLDETQKTTGGVRREYRRFPKTGAAWGTPKALVSYPWLAVFSYTVAAGSGDARPDAKPAQAASHASAGGMLHVEVYDMTPGLLMLSAATPYAGSANAAFEGARWVDQNYLVIPLDESYGSCLLWMLPEVHKLY